MTTIDVDGPVLLEDADFGAAAARLAELARRRNVVRVEASIGAVEEGVPVLNALTEAAFGQRTALDEVDVLDADWLTDGDAAVAAANAEAWRVVAVASAAGCRRVEPVRVPQAHAFASPSRGRVAVLVWTQ